MEEDFIYEIDPECIPGLEYDHIEGEIAEEEEVLRELRMLNDNPRNDEGPDIF